MKATATVYHFDMSDRDLVCALGLMPEPQAISDAYQAGRYRKAYEVEVEGEDFLDCCEMAFAKTQDTGTARSTSVGDVIVIERQGHAVMPFGFSTVNL